MEACLQKFSFSFFVFISPFFFLSFIVSRSDYKLVVRQQPKHSRMCGFAEKVDRRPIDPPPIVQLFVRDPTQLNPKWVLFESNFDFIENDDRTFLCNPYYFMYSSLVGVYSDEEMHLLRDGKTRSTTGSTVSSLYRLKDVDNTEGGFFVFPDLSVRMEGQYRLKFSLFELVGWVARTLSL